MQSRDYINQRVVLQTHAAILKSALKTFCLSLFYAHQEQTQGTRRPTVICIHTLESWVHLHAIVVTLQTVLKVFR